MSFSELLVHARQHGYAVPAFNVVDDAMLLGVLEAAELVESPVIIQVSERVARALGPHHFKSAYDRAVSDTGATAALHLDHCGDPGFIDVCLTAGWDSALYDASHLEYSKALSTTAQVVKAAAAHDAAIEGEFERIGRTTEQTAPTAGPLADALEFIEATGVAAFSPAVGTLHGHYSQRPALQPERVDALVERTTTPLVLHGATGLDDTTLRDFVHRGITKVNFSTVLKAAHTDAVRQHARETGETLEPLNLLLETRARVAKAAEHCMTVLHSRGKAA